MSCRSGVSLLLVWACAKPSSMAGLEGTLTLNRRATGEYSMDSDVDEPWATRGGSFPLESEVIDPATGEVQIDPATGNPVMEYWGFGNEWLSHNYLFTSETCRPDCTIGPFCGNGSVDGPEQCDFGDDNQVDPYGPNLCTTECNWAPYCGDGIVQPPEECDGGQSCDSKCKHAPIL
ncbi:MAG: hypothetical protein JW940_29605 [Polyangiaceae bacterium]|nr:hypothetical protein [Polyangiaceae bacterium]